MALSTVPLRILLHKQAGLRFSMTACSLAFCSSSSMVKNTFLCGEFPSSVAQIFPKLITWSRLLEIIGQLPDERPIIVVIFAVNNVRQENEIIVSWDGVFPIVAGDQADSVIHPGFANKALGDV